MKRSDPRIGIRTVLALSGFAAAIAPQAGCRAPAPPNDPFLYRSTIPPPGTITAPPAGAQPYYSAPAGVAPPMISPGTPVSPSPAPLGPSAPAMPAPVAPPTKYSPPGGFNYQSSQRSPMAAPISQTASPAAPATNRAPTDSAVVAAGNWQPANSGGGFPTNTASFTAQPRADASAVRIVEPAKPSAPVPGGDSQPAATTFTPVTAAPPSPAAGAPNAAAATTPAAPANPSLAQNAASGASQSSDAGAGSPIPLAPIALAPASAATSSTATTSAVVQSEDNRSVPEITDFPPANKGATTTQSAASATTAEKPIAAISDSKTDAAAASAVNIAAQQPGTSYGYDPDYKTLRGQLEYSANSHRWKLNYLPPEGPIDEFGGSVVLPDASQLAGFEGGDFVTVTGTFSAPTAAAGSPMFSIKRIKRQ